MLEFRLFGQFEVRANGQPLVIPSRAAQSLLAYLLVNRTTHPRREKLAGLFWPDTSETNARRSLRHELWRLRKVLDPAGPPHFDLLLSDDLSVGMNPQARFWLDVAVLEAGRTADLSLEDLQAALDVYQGELLPDFYDEWVTLERERLRPLFEQLVGRLLDQLQVAQRWSETLLWAERWIASASAGNTAQVWDAATGQELLTLCCHNSAVWGIAFSPDGTRLVTGGFDGIAKVWDVTLGSHRSEQPLTLYNPDALQVVGVDFSPDGARLAASSDGNTVRIYALPLEDILTLAKSRVTRTLTTDECQKYLHVEQCPP